MNHIVAGNLSDEALQKAARLVRDAMLASLPTPDQCAHTFSPEFQVKMNSLLARERATRLRRQLLRRVAIFFLTLVLGSGIWLAVDTEARAAVINWVREVYENSIIYRFIQEKTVAFTNYRLDVDNDYELIDEMIDASMYQAFYYNSHTGRSILFAYRPLNDGSLVGYIGGENSYTYEEVKIGSISADFYQSTEEQGTNNLIWVDEQAMLVFTIDSNLPKDDMISLAENIRKS